MTMTLEGIRVLDWTHWQQGPVATTFLADLGADVIKIENRESGEPGRGMREFLAAMVDKEVPFNTYFESQNRSKRGITIDLGKDRGREVIYRLVEESDVLVHNFRKKVPRKLGMDYETLSRINPRLVYGIASSFGPEGPQSDNPSYDALAQARCGIMTTIGDPEQPPLFNQAGLADQVGATTLAIGILAALLARERTGKGQKVESSLLGSMCWFQQLPIALLLNVGEEVERRGRWEVGNPLWNYYPTKDENWIMLAMLEPDRYWTDFCRTIGRDDLATDERCRDTYTRAEHRVELIASLDETFKTKTRDEWMQILEQGGDLIFGAVNTVFDLPDDPQVKANQYITEFDHPAHGAITIVNHPFHFSETPARVRRPAPELGQHTEEVLLEVGGYSREEIEKLRVDEIV
jgi:crotonobetainyl-CoA:carnitine CoA-transferase CaiB-like acyl-CoA transferase